LWLNGARYAFHSLFVSWAIVTTVARFAPSPDVVSHERSRNRYKSVTLLPNSILPPVCSLVVSFVVAALPATLHQLYANDATFTNVTATATDIQPAMGASRVAP